MSQFEESEDDSSLSESANEQEEATTSRQQDSTTAPTAAVHHSYLPGTSNPLFPASLVHRRRKLQSRRQSSGDSQLAILVMEGIVLLPGSTLPLRLGNSRWISYLGRKIEASRGRPNEEVRIGIVTVMRPESRRIQRPSQRDRTSWMRRAFTTGSGQGPPSMDAGAMLRQLLEDSDEEDEDVSNADEQDEDVDGSNVSEAGGSDSSGAGTTSATDMMPEENSERQDEYRLLRQTEQRCDEFEAALDAAENSIATLQHAQHLEDPERDAILDMNNQLTEAQNNLRLTLMDLSSRVHQGDMQGMAPHIERLRQRVRRQTDRLNAANFLLRRIRVRREEDVERGDPFIGRIGTVATVSYTFDETSDDEHTRPERPEERDQLVVTVLGTNRFRVVSSVEQPFEHQVPLFYNIEELPDTEYPLPPSFPQLRRQLPDEVPEKDVDQVFFYQHEQIMQGLSGVSSIPYIALKSVWPWRLVGLIRTALDQNPVFVGLRKNLPPLVASRVEDDDSIPNLLEPSTFSFWMAANMSLTDREKLVVLRMPGTVERLRFILEKVREQGRTSTNVCCKACHAVLSSAAHMFTVGGAEGTTGAYVNEYGIIHQTITLREADETELIYSGGPETRDSWFPGYSWTITYCRQCASHLGWKFISVGGRSDGEDRPRQFWGWSASAVTYCSASDPTE